MPGHRVIKLLATGGTIATTTNLATGRSAASVPGGALAVGLGAAAGDLEVVAEELANSPSWTLIPEQMAGIARAARDAARQPGVRGVVVTHGTSTLEYTAFLADLFLDVDTPVVFTGAMRRADDADPDGPRNLHDAVQVAASDEARGLGALVVFAGRILHATGAWKARRIDLDAFVDLGGQLGRVSNGLIDLPATSAARHRRAEPFAGRIDPNVALIKAVPGMGAWPLAVLPEEVRGAVVEALPGVGGIPPGMVQAVVEAAERIPVVLASRAPYGRLPETPTGGTGEPLRDARLLSAGSLTAEQAYLLLMAVLGETRSSEEAAARFVTAAQSGAPAR
jgi:L-asparaginase